MEQRTEFKIFQQQHHCKLWMILILFCWLEPGVRQVSGRKLASEDTNYALHKRIEALNGKIIYKNPRNAPSDSCPRDEDAIKRTERKCLRKCSTDADCLSRRKICICDGICGLSCIKPDRECGDLDNPVFGFVEFNGKLVGSQAKYKCQEGYHLIGQEYRRCQADGTWSSIPPECRENLYCTDPPLIPNAKHNGTVGVTRFSVNETLQYDCEHGYSTVGFNDAKCFLYNNTMQWFGPEMSCEPVSCGDPGEISNGQKDSDCYSFSCRLTYNCRPGFKLEGRNTLYCQQDGTWNPKDLPKCKPIQCELPGNPDHGKAHYTSVYYNAVVNYECNYSYMIVGPSTRTCGPDMKWTGDEPQCVAGCIVPTVENGKLSNDTRPGTQVPHGSTITVTCNKSYELSATLPPATCHNSTWTHYPHCHPARCKRLPERPRHGMVIAPKTAHGMKARYRCKDGYRLQGTSTTTCHFGNWTGRIPRCRIVYCPFPGYLTNGRVLLVGNMGMYDYRPYVKKVRNNRQIRYECNRGFYLSEGPPGATCIAGKWSPKHMPKCAPKLHPRVQWLRKKRLAIEDESSILLNTTEIHDGLYQASETTAANAEDNGVRFLLQGNSSDYVNQGDEAVIDNDDEDIGISGSDDHTSDLDVDRNYDSVSGDDNDDDDDDNDDDDNDDDDADEDDDDSDYDDDGDNDVDDDETSPSDHKPRVKNAKMRRTKYPKQPGLTEGYEDHMVNSHDLSGEIETTYQATYQQHYQANGAEVLKRVPRGATTSDSRKDKTHKKRNEWKKLGKKASHCEEIDTNDSVNVEVIRAGRDLNYTYSSGARIRVRCLKGHGLNIGNKTAKCSRGKWRPMKPECVTLPCLVPRTENGHYEFNGVQVPERAAIPHAEVVRFWCEEGHTVVGSNTLRCWYGDWTVTGIRPRCQPDPCELPSIENGGYLGGQLAGEVVEHGTTFSYTCDDGWLVNLPQITCHLGTFLPESPACVTPAQATHIGHSLPQPLKLLSFSESDVTIGRDITSIDLMTKRHSSCSPPTQIQGTVIFKNGQPISGEERRFPDGSEVTFNCISNTMGEKTTWKLHCKDGSWVGQKAPSTCNAEHDDPRVDIHPDRRTSGGNQSCIWKKSQPTVVTFHGDLELTEKVMEFQSGTELISRCVDIGKYAFLGASRRRCVNGVWIGDTPTCFALNRDYDYALDRPPTILIRHKDGPIAQTNDGKLLAYPGIQLYLECLWVRRYGTPQWNVTHIYEDAEENVERTIDAKVREIMRSAGLKEEGGGKYWTGWSTDAMRNPQLEYRLALYTTHVGDSGTYTCTTPTGHSHSVVLDIKRVMCQPLEESFKSSSAPLRRPQSKTTLNTVVTFSCGKGFTLVGPKETKCLPSGKWSAPVPRCERVKCDLPQPPEHGQFSSQGPFSVGDFLEIKCNPGYTLVGERVVQCKPNGLWPTEIARCTQACTYPGGIISGTISSVKSEYPVHDTVTYKCSSEFELHGEKTITCLEGGVWSASVPSCLLKH